MILPGTDPAAIAAAAHALRTGALVGLPTETVYGLAADADDPAAVAQIFARKGRPSDHPLIVHVPTARAPRPSRTSQARCRHSRKRSWTPSGPARSR